MSTEFPIEIEKQEHKKEVSLFPTSGCEIKEVPPFGVLIYGKIPICSFFFFVKKYGKKAQIVPGIVNFYECNMAIAYTDKLANEWCLAVEKQIEKNYKNPEDRWWKGTDTGVSSKTIFWVMTTNSPFNAASIPHDPDDFGRCYRLLDKFPQWKKKLDLVSSFHPEWKPFIENWSKLIELYEEEFESGKAEKLYDFMKKLQGGKK